jgi:hypothetical protein
MKRGLLIALTLSLVAAPAALGANVKKAQVASCLARHGVMTTQAYGKVIAPKSVQTGSLGFSFALVSGAELNNGGMAFEASAAVAQRVGSEYLTWQLARFKKAGLHVTPAMVAATYFVKDNVVVVWGNEPGSAPAGRSKAKRILSACI